MTLKELRKQRQIAESDFFRQWIYDIGDDDTLFVIYYGKHTIEDCIDPTKPHQFDWEKFHGDEFGGYIEQWKNGKFALILDRTYYESDNLEELEERLHEFNIEEDYYKEN